MAFIKKQDHPLTAKLRALARRALQPQEPFCLALSGGMDSAALLRAALPLQNERPLAACHVNHGLSARAAHWEGFCREQCGLAGAPLSVFHAPPPPPAAGEEWARNARLRAFAAMPQRAIVLAHHAQDQAETVLFRLLRGAGARGLAAMRPQTPFANKILLRPWLDVARAELAAFARAQKLRWIEDEDNRNLARRRNFLRHRVMPALAAEFPHYLSAFAASGRRLQESDSLLQDLALLDGERARRPDGGFCAVALRAAGRARAANWLYYLLQSLGARAGERHLQEAARQLTQSAGDLRFVFGGVELRRWRNRLYARPLASAPPLPSRPQAQDIAARPATVPLAQWGGALVLFARVGRGLSPARVGGLLRAQARRGGERLAPPGRPTRPVSCLMREANVAPWRRQTPLLFARGRLAAVPGVAVAAEFAAAANEPGLECLWEWQAAASPPTNGGAGV